MAKKQPCQTCGKREKVPGRHRCLWCWLPTQPAEEQVRQAQYRRQVMEGRPGYVERPRVPKAEWPAGERWCSGCQMFIPLEYTRGSMCIGHASLSAHASHLQRTYEDFTREDFDALYAWQGGRCYICGQQQAKVRLAVDHDHQTQIVRGLLCSSDSWGCNHRLIGAIEGKAGQGGDMLSIARRIVSYLEQSPLERMRAGQPPVQYGQIHTPAATRGPQETWPGTDAPPPF